MSVVSSRRAHRVVVVLPPAAACCALTTKQHTAYYRLSRSAEVPATSLRQLAASAARLVLQPAPLWGASERKSSRSTERNVVTPHEWSRNRCGPGNRDPAPPPRLRALDAAASAQFCSHGMMTVSGAPTLKQRRTAT